MPIRLIRTFFFATKDEKGHQTTRKWQISDKTIYTLVNLFFIKMRTHCQLEQIFFTLHPTHVSDPFYSNYKSVIIAEFDRLEQITWTIKCVNILNKHQNYAETYQSSLLAAQRKKTGKKVFLFQLIENNINILNKIFSSKNKGKWKKNSKFNNRIFLNGIISKITEKFHSISSHLFTKTSFRNNSIIIIPRSFLC